MSGVGWEMEKEQTQELLTIIISERDTPSAIGAQTTIQLIILVQQS